MTTATPARNSHCSWCGGAFAVDVWAQNVWPRTCVNCHHTSHLNPTPVAVLLVPVLADDGGFGVLCIRRGVAPHEGQLALPGGYVDHKDASWQHAAARELVEETGVVVDPADITLFDVQGAGGTLLVFGLAKPLSSSALLPFVATSETQERVVLTAAQTLAFPLHTEALATLFRAGLRQQPGQPLREPG